MFGFSPMQKMGGLPEEPGREAEMSRDVARAIPHRDAATPVVVPSGGTVHGTYSQTTLQYIAEHPFGERMCRETGTFNGPCGGGVP